VELFDFGAEACTWKDFEAGMLDLYVFNTYTPLIRCVQIQTGTLCMGVYINMRVQRSFDFAAEACTGEDFEAGMLYLFAYLHVFMCACMYVCMLHGAL
jgi:hypothetical protein